MAHSSGTISAPEYPYDLTQMVYNLRWDELQTILIDIKQDGVGSVGCLQDRILTMLNNPSPLTNILKQTILRVHEARLISIHQSHPQRLLSQSIDQLSHQSQQLLQTPAPSDNNAPASNGNLQTSNETPPNTNQQFEELPFFKVLQTLLKPIQCRSDFKESNLTGIFYVTDNVRFAIMRSWNDCKREYKMQVILRLVQVGRKENVTERLPYNISVTVNDIQVELPALNVSRRPGIIPWRRNDAIDITKYTDIKNGLQNTLKITWSKEPHAYIAALFVADKLTWRNLFVELKKKPLRTSEKTKMLIRKSMRSDADMGVSSMFASIIDPLSKKRLKLPARGVNCIHLQCFDAIQFLQMNEQKKTWICPLCKHKVKYENIEVDEYFLNLLQSPNLRKDCENVTLLQDGSWTDKEPTPNTLNSNDDQSGNQIDVLVLSDSDDDKHIPPKPKRSSRILNNDNVPNITTTKRKNNDCGASTSGSSSSSQEKKKSDVLCVITLD